jgi:hypothetical protein
MHDMDRRTLLLGTAGLLLAGCGGGGSGSAPASRTTSAGPNIVKPRTGNVVTAEDTAALRDRLNAALASRDVEQLVQLIDPDDFGIDDVRARWSRRYDNFERLGFVDGEWLVGLPSGRTRNGAGGTVEYDGDLVFAHRVSGCDAQQVVESYRASFRKKDADAPLELMSIGQAEASFDPSIWDVAAVDAIETDHAWIVFRRDDAQRAKASAGQIEAGARRAFEIMPRPRGVDKVMYALTWPAVDGKLYGGFAVGDALAHAYYHPFLSPDDLAAGQRTPVDAAGLPRATGRVGLHEASFSQGDLADTSCHEAVHVLANQWYRDGDTPIWAVEGLARWSEGVPKLLADRGRILATFDQFEDVVPKDYAAFHDSPQEYAFYQCSAAIYAYLEDQGGRDLVFEVAEAFYGGNREDAADTIGRSEKELLAATRTWLTA